MRNAGIVGTGMMTLAELERFYVRAKSSKDASMHFHQFMQCLKTREGCSAACSVAWPPRVQAAPPPNLSQSPPICVSPSTKWWSAWWCTCTHAP